MLSTDLRKMDKDTLAIISNQEVIQVVSQDPLVKQATKVQTINGIDIWVKELVKAHNYAVTFVNMSDSQSTSATINFTDILENVQAQTFDVRDLWAHQDVAKAVKGFTSATLAPHSSQLVTITLTKSSSSNNFRTESA